MNIYYIKTVLVKNVMKRRFFKKIKTKEFYAKFEHFITASTEEKAKSAIRNIILIKMNEGNVENVEIDFYATKVGEA